MSDREIRRVAEHWYRIPDKNKKAALRVLRQAAFRRTSFGYLVTPHVAYIVSAGVLVLTNIYYASVAYLILVSLREWAVLVVGSRRRVT